MNLLKPLTFCVSGMLLSTSLLASNYPEYQRELYLDTLEAARAGEIAEVDQALSALSDYPLLPYIYYAQATQQLKTMTPADAEALLAKLEGTPLYQRFLHIWAVHLSEKSQWPDFFNYFAQVRSPSAQLQCLAARGELAQQNQEVAYTEGLRLWLTGNSQHGACDPLFNQLIQAGKIDSEVGLERTLLALEAGNTSIAKYAERFVTEPSAQQQLALLWQIYNQPESLAADPALLSNYTPDASRLALMAIQRLASNDLRLALLTLSEQARRLQIPDSAQAPLINRLGVLYAKRFQPDAEAILAQIDPDYRFSELTEWRIRLALTEQDWSATRHMITRLPEEVRQQGRWLYWSLVADLQQGRQPDPQLLAQLTAERSYYGFKAAELTHRPFALNDKPSGFSQEQLHQIAQLAPMQRIHEFYRLERIREANQEWNLMTATLSPDQIHAAAHVIQSWGWYFQGIRGAIASDQWDDLALRFPAPYRDLFDKASKEFDIEPSWALSVTRQESAFLEVAQSGAGARG
ncbi:hypothetical protein LH51_03545 [Nitrincola sp. A-D6]|uniref:hypothetical protein n=1 Tax=Nitrincola sp. A-D6 TaxID=1545442 RepID=UPI00051F9C41|nr:hypothetical protein [Nitrincola sp. A-D6]KGK42958.1 hypothetical protein LH51_03545 [Nitrincola sp. A-D6]